VTKAPAARAAGLAVHFIGQLQTNKVRQLAGLVDLWETVDRPRLVTELAKRAPGARVLVQVDTTGEEGKGGCPLADVPALVRTATDAGLVVTGLMTVGPTEGGPEAARPGFRAVRALVADLGLATCSMGMSADLDVALEEGTTEIRVGTLLFGPRPPH
jgi:PLP dependent protein